MYYDYPLIKNKFYDKRKYFAPIRKQNLQNKMHFCVSIKRKIHFTTTRSKCRRNTTYMRFP